MNLKRKPEPWDSPDSYYTLLGFMVDAHHEGKLSVEVWDQWAYDYDYLRGVGFQAEHTDGDQMQITWDGTTLRRECEAYGLLLLEPGDELQYRDGAK